MEYGDEEGQYMMEGDMMDDMGHDGYG